jgi:hypothetical protein
MRETGVFRCWRWMALGKLDIFDQSMQCSILVCREALGLAHFGPESETKKHFVFESFVHKELKPKTFMTFQSLPLRASWQEPFSRTRLIPTLLCLSPSSSQLYFRGHISVSPIHLCRPTPASNAWLVPVAGAIHQQPHAANTYISCDRPLKSFVRLVTH